MTHQLVDSPRSLTPALRAALGCLSLTVAGVCLLMLVLLPAAMSSWPVSGPGVPTLDDAMAGLLAWGAAMLTLWLVAGTTVAALALLPGAAGRCAACLAQALTPNLIRRGLSLLLGTGIGTLTLPLGPALGAPTTGAMVTATAGASAWGTPGDPVLAVVPDPAFTVSAPDAPARGRTHHMATNDPSPRYVPTVEAIDTTSATPEPRWLPSPPVRAADPDATALLAPTPRTATLPEDVITVRKGDSLWSLAARHLGAGASDRAVARAWPQWYAANADVIGADPDLIRPGQQLRIPTLGDHR